MINPDTPNYSNTPVHPQRPHYSYSYTDNNITPGVTIVTPFYNTGYVFRETIQAISQQSFQNFEWIIIDDGSDDPISLQLLNELQQQDTRIKVIHQVNQGPSAARNRGVRESQANYFFQIDADDLIEPTFIEKCLWHLESYPEYSFCNTYSVGFAKQTYLWPIGFERSKDFWVENQVVNAAIIRKSVHLAIGGYDESIRYGHEDWDYWLNMAHHGYWGKTIPEYLFWYRRQDKSRIEETQSDPTKNNQFREFLHNKYPLLNNQFPEITLPPLYPYTIPPTLFSLRNSINHPSHGTRVLMLLPWLVTGGADKFNLDLVEQLSQCNHEITICTNIPSNHPWLSEFGKFTPDIFNLPNFLKLSDYPRFLLYLIESRQIDIVFISNSYLGYHLLPFLRAYCPQVTFVDYTHIEDEYWQNGGYPRAGVGYQEQLDLNMVSTHHLKEWMVSRGGDPTRIEVCYTNIGPQSWNPTNYQVGELRAALNIPLTMPLLLYAGRICEQKRPRIFAEIIRRLLYEQKEKFICLVAGDGPDLTWLKAFAQQHDLASCLIFLGAVSQERMKELQAMADIFLLPSQMEGLSLALFEAMAMETVPVAADVGGQRELVTPECGFLISHGENEIDEYIAVLKYLIESPEVRHKMAAVSREQIIQYFRLDQMTKKMIQLLNRAQSLARTNPRPSIGRGLGLECATQTLEYSRLGQEFEHHLCRVHELVANNQYLHRQWEQLRIPLASQPIDQEIINQLSGQEISQYIPIKKIIKAIGFKVAKQPGLTWLYNWRSWGKRLIDG